MKLCLTLCEGYETYFSSRPSQGYLSVPLQKGEFKGGFVKKQTHRSQCSRTSLSRINQKSTLYIVALIIFLLVPLWLFSTTWHIKHDGTGNFTTIQEGIDASADMDTVLVYPGTYYENINYNGKDIIVASLELITGDEQYIATTVIDGNQQGSCVRFSNNEQAAILRGFSIANGIGDITYGDIDRLGGGILITTPYQTNPIETSIINCNIFNNDAVYGGGIYINNANVTLSGVSIYNNNSSNGGGICIIDESNLIFDPVNLCNLYNNFSGQALDILASNAINDIHVVVDTFTVQDQFNYYAFYQHSSTTTGEITIELQNHFLERIDHDLYVSTIGNDDNSGLSITDPIKTIAVALQRIKSNSSTPKTVYVAEGIYSKELNNQIYPFSGKKFVSLIGENTETTILKNDYSESTYTLRHDNGSSTFEKFTLQNDGQNSHAPINIGYSSDIELINIVIENCNVRHGSILMISCYEIICDYVILRNNYSEDSAGLWLINGNYKFKNCIIDNNDSIGPDQFISNLYCIVEDYLVLENCIFSNSDIPTYPGEEYHTIQITAQQDCSPNIKISNCLFANNTNQNGDYSVYIRTPGSIEINNSTFTQNTSHISPLALVGVIDFRNNIMYNNISDYDLEINTGNINSITSTLNVEYCNIEGGEAAIYPGNPPNLATINWLEGNINADPLFQLSGYHPFQLTEYSPCIDTGTPDTTGLFLPPWDLLFHERVWDGDENVVATIDMGCYEFGAPSIVSVEDPVIIPANEINLSNYPNPFNPETTISFNLPESAEVKVEIYNIKGQRVKTLMDCTTVSGKYELVWAGKDDNNKPVSSGVYFYQLNTSSKIVTKRMLMLK